jgi:hypothetical protein
MHSRKPVSRFFSDYRPERIFQDPWPGLGMFPQRKADQYRVMNRAGRMNASPKPVEDVVVDAPELHGASSGSAAACRRHARIRITKGANNVKPGGSR